MIINKIKIYIRMLNNYNKMCKDKTIYFYIYSIPIFGLLSCLIIKLILSFRNKKLVNYFLNHKVYLSSIRYLTLSEKLFLSNNLNKYNSKKNFQNNTFYKKKLGELKLNGFCKLGKVFTDKECETFISSLIDKDTYNSQVILQSSGIKTKFRPLNHDSKNKNAYFCFTSEVFKNFKPIKKLLNNTSFTQFINTHLNFDASIYACHTWYNPKTSENHYVHRSHRDYDDFKFVGLIIYWNKISRKNGATTYIKGSHKAKSKTESKSYLEGESGEAFLVDLSGLHSGTQVSGDFRYTTFIRFGHKFNYASVIDGFLHSMEI